MGGCLPHFVAQWSAQGALKLVLGSVHGLSLEFSVPPPLSHALFMCYSAQGIGAAKQISLHQEVQALLCKGAIGCAPRANGFHTQIFLIPKKNVKL